jgi:hypothetical protein
MNKVIWVVPVLIGLAFSTYSVSAQAQLGGLGKLGGAKTESSDTKSEAPRAGEVEAGLRLVIEQTSRGQAKLADAMGLKEEATKLNKNADCTKAKNCSLADSIGVTQGANDILAKAMKESKEKGTKISGDAAKTALSAIDEVIGTLAGWQVAANGAKGLMDGGAMAIMKLGDLGKALPKVPGAMAGTGKFAKDGVDFLSYNGVDTKALQKKMQM